MHANIIHIIACIKTIHLVLVDLILSYVFGLLVLCVFQLCPSIVYIISNISCFWFPCLLSQLCGIQINFHRLI